MANEQIVWDDEQKDFDLLGDIQTNLPGVRITSGYRTPEYQEQMRKRGYKPARNSAHLYGDAIDIGEFPGMTLAEGAQFLKEKYPSARIRYGDKNHLDHVHFSMPGYGKFPMFGGAAAEQAKEPENTITWDDEGGIVWDDEKPAATVQSEAPETERFISGGGYTPDAESPRVSKEIEDYYVSALQDQNIPLSEINLQMRRMAAAEGVPLMGEAFDMKAAEDYRKTLAEGGEVSNQVGYENYFRMLPQLDTTSMDPTANDIEAAFEEGQAYNPMNILTQAYRDFSDAELQGGVDKAFLQEQFPDATPEQLEQLHDEMIGRRRFEELQSAQSNVDQRNMNPLARGALNMAGGVSPVDAFGFGAPASLAGRGVVALTSNQAIDAAMQMGDMAYGAQEDFSNTQNIVAGLAGAGFHGVLELGGAGLRRVFGRGADGRGSYIDVETADGGAKRIYRGSDTPEEVPQSDGFTEETVPDFLKNPVKAKGADGKPRKTRGKPKPVERGLQNEYVAARKDELTKDWKNSPEFLIVNNIDELDDKLAAEMTADNAEESLGVTLPDGRVLLLTDNITSPEQVDAVIFHEALGHVGLNQQYGEGLDDLLQRMYDGNENLRADVDSWLKGKTDPEGNQPYNGSVPRAVEEVLAELSESGRIDRNLWDALKVYIARMAERMGLKKRNFSDGEVLEILRQGHERVINGESSGAAIPGMRYIRAWHASKAEFSEFSDDYMSTGEGAQAYGWGHYFAQDEGVRNSYARKFDRKVADLVKKNADVVVNDKGQTWKEWVKENPPFVRIKNPKAEGRGRRWSRETGEPLIISERLDRAHYDPDTLAVLADYREMLDEAFYSSNKKELVDELEIIESVHNQIARKSDNVNIARASQAVANNVGSLISEIKWFQPLVEEGKSTVYEVELPDEDWLDFDAPVKEQPEAVQKAFQKLVDEEFDRASVKKAFKQADEELRDIRKDIEEIEHLISKSDDEDYIDLREGDLENLKEMEEEVLKERQDIVDMLKDDPFEGAETGSDLYYKAADYFFKGDEKALSKYLNEQGVPGNAFLDGGSRFLPSVEEQRKKIEEVFEDELEYYRPLLVLAKEQLEARPDDKWRQAEVSRIESEIATLEKNYKNKLASIKEPTRNFVSYNTDEIKVVNRFKNDENLPGGTTFTDLGIDSNFVDNNLRYMRSAERGERRLGVKTKSKRNITPVVDDIISKAPERLRMTWEEVDAQAREYDIDFDEIMSIEEGITASEAHAVGIAFVVKAEKVERLAKLIADNKATGAQMDAFRENYLELASLYEKYARIANNAGRLLASFRLAKQSSSNAGLRFMREDAAAVMNLPAGAEDEGVRALARDLAEGRKTVGGAMKETSKGSDALMQAINLPRTLMSSFDLSAPLRQGVFLITTPNYWKAFGKMFQYMGSEKAFQGLQDSIRQHPNYLKMREAGLSVTDTEGHNMTTHEEDFQSEWGKKIPIIGRGVKGSERAFVGFLNKLRADTFNQYLRDFQRAGHDINDPELLKAIGSFINAATGRGELPDGKGALPDMRGAAPMLNGFFFSPRLISSRMTLLNPAYYGKLPRPVQLQAIRNLLGFMGVAATTAALATMNGLDVEVDPRSSDFMKIRYGTKRFDILGGFGQFITLFARVVPEMFAHVGIGDSGYTKTIKGDVKPLQAGMAERSGWDVFVDFYRNKASPIGSLFIDLLEGENAIGERVSLHEPFSGTKEGEEPIPWNKNAIVSRMAPIFVQDIFEVINKEGIEGIPYIAPSLFGIGYSNFDQVPSESPLRPENNPDSPAVQEMMRLAEITKKDVFGAPSRTISLNGVKTKLDDEMYAKYTELADKYILEDVEATVADPAYQALSDAEKIEELKKVGEIAREAAREDLGAEVAGEAPMEDEIVWDN